MAARAPDRAAPRRPLLWRLGPQLGSPRLPWLAAALAVTLCLPALGGGLTLDDYFHRTALLGGGPPFLRDRPLLHLFNFLPPDAASARWLQEKAGHPWWVSPDLDARFLRPVTAATHLLDYALWPHNFALQHAHSLLWLGLAVLAVAGVYREVGALATAGAPAAAVAGLAALMFAVEEYHNLPAAWLANRNALIAMALAAAGLLWHLRWRRLGGPQRLALSLLLTALGLLAAEAALAVVGYMAAYALTLDRGPLRRRAAALLPVGGLVLAWRLVYSHLGFGARGSGLYLDPLQDPGGFFAGLLERAPLLLLTQFSQVSIDLWVALPRPAQLGLSGVGLLATLALVALCGPLLRRSAVARFWGLGLLLALVPACSAFPMSRLTLFLGVGAFGLLACLAREQGLMGPPPPAAPPSPWRRRAAATLTVLHLPLAALLLPVGVVLVPAATGFVTRFCTDVLPDDPAVERQHLILVNGYDMLTMYVDAVREAHGLARPRSVAQLASLMNSRLRLRRQDAHTLTIAAEGGYFATGADRLFWTPAHPFAAGDRRQTANFTATVLQATPDGRPLEVSFRFRHPLNHPSYLLRVIRDGGVRPLQLAVGQEQVLAGDVRSLM